MKQFIINDIRDNSLSRHEYIKQNGVKSMQISPRVYSFRNIFMFLKTLFMYLFLYISF